MKFILGVKQNMTQVFDDERVFPVTVISAGPVVVTQVKTKDSDGYESVQVGFGEKKAARINKAQKGHYKELGNFKFLKEFRMANDGEKALAVGDKIDVSVFKPGDVVTIASTSKGKGFQSAIKRHGFSGQPRTHGQKHSEKDPGTIGGGLRTRVPSGMRMAGRMGSDRVTLKNVKVVQVDAEKNLILLKGGIPGKRGTLVEIISI